MWKISAHEVQLPRLSVFPIDPHHSHSGLECEGLFRRSPNSAMLRHAKEAYDRGNFQVHLMDDPGSLLESLVGQPVSLSSFGDPHIAAVLLKKVFRDLPQPVFPEYMYPVILACPPPSSDPSDRSCIDYIRNSILPLVENTSPATLIVLSYVLRESPWHWVFLLIADPVPSTNRSPS